MATVKLTASAYTLSNSNYMTVTNPSYMYDNTSDTSNYATIRGRAGRSSNNTYYCYLHGFNFGAILSNATVSSFTVKIKGYRNSYQSTGSSYRVRLCGSATNSAISGTTCSSDWGTSATTLTIPTGSLTWSQIVNYGSGFSIQLRLRNSSTSSSYYPYLYIYGAEIEVTYTVPVTTYTVSVSSTDQTLTAVLDNGQASRNVPAGQSATIYIDGSDFTGLRATDNEVDVTSSLVYVPEDTDYPAYYQYDIAAVNEAHTIVVSRVVQYSVTASTSVSGVTLTLYDDYGNASGTSMSVTAGDGGALVVAASDYSGIHLTDNGVDVTSSLLLYNNNTKRYSFSNVQAAHTLVVTRATTYSVTASTSVSGWQVAVFDNNNPNQTTQIEAGDTAYVMILGGDYTGLRVTDNGVDVTSSLQYDDSGNTPIYYYAITNVQEAHVIVVSKTVSPVRVKQNGSWITAQKVLVKQNGSWVIGTVKVKDGGTWK
jgi:hypothetical protein